MCVSLWANINFFIYEDTMAKNGFVVFLEKGLRDVELPDADYKVIKDEFDRLCDEQEKIDNTGFGEVFECINKKLLEGKSHPILYPYTDDEDVLKKALEMTGHNEDKAFCKRFWKHYKLFVKGKELQTKGMDLLEKNFSHEEKQVEGWLFIPWTIVGPTNLVEFVDKKMRCDAQEGKGIFCNIIQIPQEDESLDDYLVVEPYGLKSSFFPFLEELKQYGIVDDFLGQERTQGLFAVLKEAAGYMKNSTDKPLATKNKIAELVNKLGVMPKWGLFLQILTLQGLSRLLEDANIKEGDDGYNEVDTLFWWLSSFLIAKEIEFCYKPYGKDDLECLKPFCVYLMNTDVGKWVQNNLFNRRIYLEQITSNHRELQTNNYPDIEKPYDNTLDSIFNKKVKVSAVKEALDKLAFKKTGRVEWYVVYKVFLHLKWLKNGCEQKTFLQWVNLQYHCGWTKEHHFTFRDVHKTMRDKDISCWNTIDNKDYTKGVTYYNFAVLLRNTFEIIIINGKESKEPVTDFSQGDNRDRTSFMVNPAQLINWGK